MEVTIERSIEIDSPVGLTRFCLTNLDATDKLLGARCRVKKIAEGEFRGKTLGFWGTTKVIENKKGLVRFVGEGGKHGIGISADVTVTYSPTPERGTSCNCRFTIKASGFAAVLLGSVTSALPVLANLIIDDALKVAKMYKRQPEKVKKILTTEQWDTLQAYLTEK